MSKLESGEMQLEEVPFNLNELLHDWYRCSPRKRRRAVLRVPYNGR